MANPTATIDELRSELEAALPESVTHLKRRGGEWGARTVYVSFEGYVHASEWRQHEAFTIDVYVSERLDDPERDLAQLTGEVVDAMAASTRFIIGEDGQVPGRIGEADDGFVGVEMVVAAL